MKSYRWARIVNIAITITERFNDVIHNMHNIAIATILYLDFIDKVHISNIMHIKYASLPKFIISTYPSVLFRYIYVMNGKALYTNMFASLLMKSILILLPIEYAIMPIKHHIFWYAKQNNLERHHLL